ncbi:MAG: nucleotidyltransferase domain-containing protein [Anaerolineales bacterium]|nr:nucleotidyltransferase domain-containing protein [Anaerolineales bacterium]
MDLKTSALNKKESQALRVFANQVQKAYRRQVRQMALFGSKARGDSHPDSDIDVLVIVNQEDRDLRRRIIDIASELSLEFDVLLSPRVVGEKRWQTRQQFSTYRNIARDMQAIAGESG